MGRNVSSLTPKPTRNAALISATVAEPWASLFHLGLWAGPYGPGAGAVCSTGRELCSAWAWCVSPRPRPVWLHLSQDLQLVIRWEICEGAPVGGPPALAQRMGLGHSLGFFALPPPRTLQHTGMVGVHGVPSWQGGGIVVDVEALPMQAGRRSRLPPQPAGPAAAPHVRGRRLLHVAAHVHWHGHAPTEAAARVSGHGHSHGLAPHRAANAALHGHIPAH